MILFVQVAGDTEIVRVAAVINDVTIITIKANRQTHGRKEITVNRTKTMDNVKGEATILSMMYLRVGTSNLEKCELNVFSLDIFDRTGFH